MRIRAQLYVAGTAALLVVALVALGAHAVSARGERALRLQAASQEVARNVASLLTLTQEHTAHASRRPADQWRARQALLLAALDRALADEGSASPGLAALRAKAGELPSLFGRLESLPSGNVDEFTQRRRELLIERLLVELQELVEARYAWSQLIGQEHARQQQHARLLAIAGPAALFLVLAFLAYMVRRRLLLPLEQLRGAAIAIQAGDLDARASLVQADELGDTGRAIDQMAAALVGERQRLRVIVDNVPALISHIDHDRRYTMVNRAYEQWGASPVRSLVGCTVAEARGPAAWALLAPHLDRAFAGEPVSFEVELARGDETRAVQVAYVPELDAAGRVCGVFALKSDVTDIKRAEQRLRLVMESSPLGIAIRGLQRELLYANAAWYRLSGAVRAEPAEAGREPVVHPDDLSGVADDREAALAGSATVSREFRFVHGDGAIVWVLGYMTRLERAGRVEGVLSMLQDISERRRLDAELALRSEALTRSNQDLERFAYVASHDLQEPLRMVTSYGQLLTRRHQAQLGAEAREFLAFMVDGGQRAQALIRDLLSLARLDSQPRAAAPVALDDVLSVVLRQLREAVGRSGATVTRDPLPTLPVDRRQVEQLFTNLIANACKFKRDEALRIHVGAARQDASWRFSVSDNGIGIDPKHFERIFVMFQRLHLRSAHPGTGIGLAICRRVVERHGGRIWVESEPGRGSTFHFSLPDGPSATPSPAGREEAALS